MISEILKNIAQLFTWFTVIAPWEQAIRVRMGKKTKLLSGGWCVTIPFIDKIYKQSVRRRLRQLRPQTLTTKDGYVVTCAGAIGFSVTDLNKLYDTLECPNDTIESEIGALISNYVGNATLKECSIVALEDFVKSKVNLSKYGLGGDEFYLLSFSVCKTYRLITGELASWNHDGGMTMSAEPRSGIH